MCIVVIKNYSVCCGQFKPAQTGLEKGQVGHSPRPGHQTLLVTSSGVHWKPVQTHLALPLPRSNIWWWPLKHVRFPSGRCASYWNAFLYIYKARHAHKRLYMVLPKYSKIQVLPGITSCRLVKDNKQAIELNSLLINNMPKDGYEWN